MEDIYANIQGTIPPANDNNTDIYANIQGATPIEEEKKNIPTPTQGQGQVTQPTNQATQTNNMGGVDNTPANTRFDNKVKPTHFQDFVNVYSATQEKPLVERAGYSMFDDKGRTLFETVTPTKAAKPTKVNAMAGAEPVQIAPKVTTKPTEVKPDDTKRADGTDKGKGFYGEITVQSGEEKGKTMTELTTSYTVDDKEIEVPLLNPYTSLDDIENVRAGGQPSEQMYRDAERWLDYCLKNNRSPFATEEETVNIYTDEDNKIKFQTATDLQRYVASNLNEIDLEVLRGDETAFRKYPVGSMEYQEFMEKSVARDMLNEEMEQFSKDTGFEPRAYFAYQDYLINGGTSFEDWKKEYNPQSKIGIDEALALTVATLPTLIYDVVYRDGDMIKRIAKGTGEYATGLRTGSIMGDLSYVIQGLFTLTKDGKYNPFQSAGELKQTDVEWLNRFDRNAKDEVAMFMGSIGVDYMPFEAAGNVTNKLIQTLTKANASNYYNLMLKTGVMPESAMNITEKIVSSGMQMGGTLLLYTGAQSTLNQMMYSTPEQFMTEGIKTVWNDATSSALTGFIAGGIGGAMGVLTNQIKNKIISDAMKNGLLDATKLQKFAYVGTGVAGGTVSTILEASTFVAMSGEELNTENILKESIKFATLKFQNPAGLKIDKLQNRTTIDPRFTPEKAWSKEFEPKLNEAELEMLGCKNVAEVKELVKKEGLDAVITGIPTSTACKLANAEYGIVVPAKEIDFAPDKVTITNETINGKEYSVVNTWNKQGELTHVSPHENYKDAATEVEFITNKMQEYKVYKAADRIKPEWYAEFNQTANVDKIALNDALQAANPTPEQTKVIKDFNKQVDDFIAKKEKETPMEKPKKKEKDETETATEVKETEKTTETPIEYEGKEYTVTEKDGQTTIQVKDAYGKDVPVRDSEIETKVKELYDTQDKAGLQGSERKGEKPIETKPVESTGEKEVATSGDVQTSKEKEVTQAYSMPREKEVSISSEKIIFNKKDILRTAASSFKKGLKEGIKTSKADMKALVNNVKAEVNSIKNYLSPKEFTKLLTDIGKAGTSKDYSKTQMSAIESIIKTIDLAQERSVAEGDIYKYKTNKDVIDAKIAAHSKGLKEGIKTSKADMKLLIDLVKEEVVNVKKYLSPNKYIQLLDAINKAGTSTDNSKTQMNALDKISKILNEAYAQSKLPTSPKEYRTLNDVRIAKEKERMLTIRETAKSVSEFSTQIETMLKENKSNGTLSPSRYNALIRKMKSTIKGTKTREGVVITREMKKDAIIDFVADSLIEAQNSKSQKEAIKGQKKAKKLIDSKQQNFGEKSLEALNLVSNIDISQLTPEQTVKFNEVVNEMASNKNRQTPETIDKFMSDLQDIQWTPKEKKAATKEDVASLIEDIFTTPVNTLADYKAAKGQLRKLNNLIDKIYSDKVNKLEGTQEQIDKGIEKAKKERDEMLDYIESKNQEIDLVSLVKNDGEFVKQKYMDNIDVTSKEFMQKMAKNEDTGLTDRTNMEAEFVFQSLKDPKIVERIKPEDAELIDYAMTNLNNGFYNGQTAKAIRKVFDIVNTYEIADAFNTVKNNKSTKKLQDKSADEILTEMRTSNDYRLDLDVFGSMGHKIQKSIFQKNIENIAAAKRFVADTWKEVGDAFDGLRKSKEIRKNKNRYKDAVTKLAILRTELAWQNNIQRDPKTGKKYQPTDKSKPDYMKTHSDAALFEKDLSSVKDRKDFDRFEKVWNDIKSNKDNFNQDGTLNIEKIYNELSPAEKKVWDNISKLNEVVDKYVELASIKHGRIHNRLNNYDYYHKINETTKGDKDAESLLNNLLDSYESPTKQAGSTHERDMVARIIRTDMDNMIKKQLNEVAHDIYVRDNLLSTMRGLDAAAKEVGGFIAISNATKRNLGERSLRAENKEQITNTTKIAEGIFGYMSKKYLGLPTRILKELPTNFERAIVGEWSKDVVKNVESEYIKMLDDMIGESKNYSQFAEDISTGKSLGSRLIEDIVIFSDRMVAPPVFKSAFNKSFKKSTGKDFSIKEYQTNPKYRQEHYKAINDAKTDGFIRLQELFNSKSALGSATHVKMMNHAIDKRSGAGKMLYFLQSFSHNEFNQMVRSTKKLASKETFAEGARDILALTSSNYMYMQIGMAMLEYSKAYWAQVADEDNPNPLTAFEDGMYNFWKNNYSNPEVIIASTLKSLSAMATGKYGIMTNLLGSAFLGFVKRDDRLSKETKEIIYAQTKGLGMRPMDFSSDGYSSASSFAKAMHPILVEIVDAADIIEKAADLSGVTDNKEEQNMLNLAMLINGLIRYAHVNPASNQIDKWFKGYEKANKKDKTKKEETSTFGTGTGYTNETEEYSTKGGFINQTEEYSNDSE